ncbi:MAG: AAA family ATPase [Bacteroidota bacterium]|nr:AAA family ATPase [Bacteroidota bacterium]
MPSSPKPVDNQRASLRLTAEQEAIIRSTGNIRINAVAGSGKTTTIVHYAATRPAGSRILYLAYNRSVKTEAVKRFAAHGLHSVKVETAHSLAFKPVVIANGYKVRQQEYKIYEIAELLGLQGSGEKHGEYILANHIHKFTHYFCNSRAVKVQDLNYLDIVQDEKAKTFVRNFYAQIEHGTRLLLGKMYKGEIEITHDFYLKRYQLMNPVLPYDYILFDEGQDASPAMLHIFLQQKGTKVIVGDTHQQIYAWRHAVNSLESAGFTSFALSTSFRFHQDIADLAKKILSWKEHLQETSPVTIIGKGTPPKPKTKATLARTNLGLLVRAITFITDHPSTKHLYFEGNINSYTYADDGASLYDVLSLHNGNTGSIRDQLIRSMKSMEDLEDYIEKTEDVQLGMMVELVEEYGNEIPSLIRSLKSKHVSDEEKDKAEMIFSTVHRAKGMEYDAVQVVEDFITEARLQKLKAETELTKEPLNLVKWNEEINLLYVAVTRTKGVLRIPETLLPKDFPVSPHINVIKTKEQEGKKAPVVSKKPYTSSQKAGNSTSSTKSYTERRLAHKNAYAPWSADTDAELIELYVGGADLASLADYFDRNKGAIFSRLKKLGYWED